jgi:hypothetical protein
MTWISFAIWLAVGLVIYLTYSIRNSKQRYHKVTSTTVAVRSIDSPTSPSVDEIEKDGDDRITNEKM